MLNLLHAVARGSAYTAPTAPDAPVTIAVLLVSAVNAPFGSLHNARGVSREQTEGCITQLNSVKQKLKPNTVATVEQ